MKAAVWIAAVWSRFLRWLRVRKLEATIAALEADLADLRALREHCDWAEDFINEHKQRTQVALYHATRKGGV